MLKQPSHVGILSLRICYYFGLLTSKKYTGFIPVSTKRKCIMLWIDLFCGNIASKILWNTINTMKNVYILRVRDSRIGYFAFSPFIYLIIFSKRFDPRLENGNKTFRGEKEVVLMSFCYVTFWDTLCWRARASHCGGFSCCGAGELGAQASVVVARELSSCGLRALECRLSSCGAWA